MTEKFTTDIEITESFVNSNISEMPSTFHPLNDNIDLAALIASSCSNSLSFSNTYQSKDEDLSFSYVELSDYLINSQDGPLELESNSNIREEKSRYHELDNSNYGSIDSFQEVPAIKSLNTDFSDLYHVEDEIFSCPYINPIKTFSESNGEMFDLSLISKDKSELNSVSNEGFHYQYMDFNEIPINNTNWEINTATTSIFLPFSDVKLLDNVSSSPHHHKSKASTSFLNAPNGSLSDIVIEGHLSSNFVEKTDENFDDSTEVRSQPRNETTEVSSIRTNRAISLNAGEESTYGQFSIYNGIPNIDVSETADGIKVSCTVFDTETSRKPAYKVPALIALAIQNHPEEKLTVHDIFNYIIVNFPYYKQDGNRERCWTNIRNHLHKQKYFKKVSSDPKTTYYMMNPSARVYPCPSEGRLKDFSKLISCCLFCRDKYKASTEI